MLDYYGFDSEIDAVIDIHAHYELVIGDDHTKNYHLTIEDAFLASSRKQGLFRIPSPEFEYMVFVIRMMLKHGVWEAPIVGRRRLSASELREAEYLEARANRASVAAILRRYVPNLSPQLFDKCAASSRRTVWVGRGEDRPRVHEEHRRQRASTSLEGCTTQGLAAVLALAPMAAASRGGQTQAGGGGGDHRDRRRRWLGQDHGGRGSVSVAVDVLRHARDPHGQAEVVPDNGMRAGHDQDGKNASYSAQGRRGVDQPSSTPIPFDDAVALVRQVLTARDRFLTYRRARRFVSSAGLVVSDRYPLPQVELMDGGGECRLLRGRRHAFPRRGDRIPGPTAGRVLRAHRAAGAPHRPACGSRDRRPTQDRRDPGVSAEAFVEIFWSLTGARPTHM